ncbi:MAG: S24/S26 family peptidase [Acidobacteriota bacterium]
MSLGAAETAVLTAERGDRMISPPSQPLRSMTVEAVRSLPAGTSFTVTVSGHSMVPVLLEGDAVVARRRGAESPRLWRGDLVVFDAGKAGLAVHRLLVQGPTGVRTRGDGTGRMDPPVAWDDVLGRVESVRRDGREVGENRLAASLAWMRQYAAAVTLRLGRRLALALGEDSSRKGEPRGH